MKNIFLFLLSFSLILVSCTDEIDGLTIKEVSPVVSAPIGKVTFSTDNISELYDSVTFDNININLSEDGSASLKDINLRILSQNSSPNNISVQLYFLDSTAENGTIVLDSLFDSVDESVISPAAEVNNNGVVTSPTTLLSEVMIDQEKYERIKTSSKIMLFGRISSNDENTTDQENTDNYLSISFGLSAQLIIDPMKL